MSTSRRTIIAVGSGEGACCTRTWIDGPDAEAVRAQDRGALRFDLGLGASKAEICVRSADVDAIALLRSACGRPLLEQQQVAQQLPSLSPHRVFRCHLSRIEVYQAIPAPAARHRKGRTPCPAAPAGHCPPRCPSRSAGSPA